MYQYIAPLSSERSHRTMSMNTQRKRKRSMKRIQTKELLLGDRNDTQKKDINENILIKWE